MDDYFLLTNYYFPRIGIKLKRIALESHPLVLLSVQSNTY